MSGDNDLRQAEWPDIERIRSVEWNDERTALIFSLDDGTQKILKVRRPKRRPQQNRSSNPSRHIDLTIMERVDAVISEKLR